MSPTKNCRSQHYNKAVFVWVFFSFCHLLTVTDWAQNRCLDIDGSTEGCGFDSHLATGIFTVHLAHGRLLHHPLGFQKHLELAL